jgi:hypothetical protein
MSVSGLSLSGALAVAGTPLLSTVYVAIPASTLTKGHMRFLEGVAPTNMICGQVFYDGFFGHDLCGGMRTYANCCMWNKTLKSTVTAWASPPTLASSVTMIDGAAGIGTRTITSGVMKQGVIFRFRFKGIISTKDGASSGRMSVVTTAGGVDTEIYAATLPLSHLTNSIAWIEMDMRIDTVSALPILGTMTVIGRAVTETGVRSIFGTGNIDTTLAQTLDIRYSFDSSGNTLECYTATIEIIY